MAIAYLGIGTNIGDRGANISRALREISRASRVLAVSRVYQTAPIGYADQPAFWNLAVKVSTSLPARDLLLRLKDAERLMGRTVTFANGPRVIDIDVLFYDDLVVDDGVLVVPHPRVMERAFVLRPLVEIASLLVHPGTGGLVFEGLGEVADQVAVVLDEGALGLDEGSLW